jgi:Flp pilus assembly protein TadG
MIEATFCLMAFVAIIFLIMDLSWAVFAKLALQNGVRAGVRYAVTSQTSGSLGQVASIQQEVEQQSMGFISAAQASSLVSVCFFSVTSNPPASLGCGTGATATSIGPANSGGNLVVVSVNNYTVAPFAPLYRNSAPVSMSVSSGDLIESSGTGSTPPSL